MSVVEVPYNDFPQQYRQEREALVGAVEDVMARGDFVLGRSVAEFEERFAKLCGVLYAIGVGSGTDALILALRLLDIGPGDEVITVSNSWISTVSSIVLVGATPVFVDVADDMNIDPDRIEDAVTERTKAVLPVHLTGRPAKMDRLQRIADQHGLYVIEDAAQAVGATYRGRKIGSIGDLACFSVHPLKNLNACGDGGIVTCNNGESAERCRLLRNHGLVDRDHVRFWGYCTRLDSIQAEILTRRLDHLASIEESRRQTAEFYNRELDDVVTTPGTEPCEGHVYHTYVIQTDRRDELQAYLSERGISAKVHYPIPVHLQEAASSLGYGVGSLPNTERLCGRILTLPVNQFLSDDQKHHVVDSVRSFFD
ncbi:MAG: transcriptional regulator [Gemmatimonadetes bacterium]|nr:transcriptional regulator [Gemmatimonadota bacterium]|tara:strand:+ start:9422 stop:10525 length:1104 start_codon:yes stop_codon:yes gene_type:complete